MKAEIKAGSSGTFVIDFWPENPSDAESLKALAEELGSAHIINCQGIQYMTPNVKFYVGPFGRED